MGRLADLALPIGYNYLGNLSNHLEILQAVDQGQLT